MPAERRPPQRNRRLPFNPPRPRASTSSAGPSKATPKSNSKTKKNTATASASKPFRRQKSPTESLPSTASASESESASESASRERGNSLSSEEPDYILAEIITASKPDDDVTSNDPTIPPKLLTRLLHHHFQNKKTKIAKDANGVVAKYVDIFVREALARAAYERSESEGGADSGAGRAIGNGFLEVEDLEKMAPQLVLDF